ncbi:MAG: hypothetical protein ACLR6J_12290 [Parabacteroides merdae]
MRQSRRLRKGLRKATNVAVLLLALLAVPRSRKCTEREGFPDARCRRNMRERNMLPSFEPFRIQSGSGRMDAGHHLLRRFYVSSISRMDRSVELDQFLLSLLAMPDMWMRVPFIALSNPELAAYYDLTDGECLYPGLDSNGNYKLQ